MAKVETLVFDLGGVLIDWNPRYSYARLDSTGSKVEQFLKEVATRDWNSTLDRGLSFDAAIQSRSSEFPEWSSWLQNWKIEWPTMLKGPIHEMVDVLDRAVQAREAGLLKQVLALSNWSEQTFEIAKARFPFLDQFDGVLISGRERLAKPDPKFFQLLVERFQVDARRSLFIDDVRENIETAKSLNFQTYHFEEPSKYHLKNLNEWLKTHVFEEKN